MTTETSTNNISSISGSNLNTISGTSKPPHHVQKRTVHQFETDKIEVQSSEHSSAPRSALSKVCNKSLQECPRLEVTMGQEFIYGMM